MENNTPNILSIGMLMANLEKFEFIEDYNKNLKFVIIRLNNDNKLIINYDRIQTENNYNMSIPNGLKDFFVIKNYGNKIIVEPKGCNLASLMGSFQYVYETEIR